MSLVESSVSSELECWALEFQLRPEEKMNPRARLLHVQREDGAWPIPAQSA